MGEGNGHGSNHSGNDAGRGGAGKEWRLTSGSKPSNPNPSMILVTLVGYLRLGGGRNVDRHAATAVSGVFRYRSGDNRSLDEGRLVVWMTGTIRYEE